MPVVSPGSFNSRSGASFNSSFSSNEGWNPDSWAGKSLKLGSITVLSAIIVVLLRMLFNTILGIAPASLISSAIQGAITGGLSLLFFPTKSEDAGVKARLWVAYPLGSAIASLPFVYMSDYILGGSGGDPPPFWGLVLSFGAFLLIVIAFFVVSLLITNSLASSLGIGVASEITEEEGESFGEKYLSLLVGGKDWGKRLNRMDGCNFFVRAIVTGAVSWMAAYIFEMIQEGSEGFFQAIEVELFGTVTAYVYSRIFLSTLRTEMSKFGRAMVYYLFVMGALLMVILTVNFNERHETELQKKKASDTRRTVPER